MITDYKYNITASIPDLLREDFRHLEAAWGESLGDLNPVRLLSLEDSLGNQYASINSAATGRLLSRPGSPVERPDYDTEELIDLEAAERARLLLDIWPNVLDPTKEPPTASTDKIVVYLNTSPDVAFQMMGLTRIEINEP